MKVRDKLSFRQPASYEEVMAMPLQYIVSQRDPRWWATLSRYGITHVRHFWDEGGRHWRALGDDEPSTTQISDLLPRPWTRTLRKGKQPLAPDEWALYLAPRAATAVLARVKRDHGASATILTYARCAAIGWRPNPHAPLVTVPQTALARATVEEHNRSPDHAGPIVMLSGDTARSYAASRAAFTTPTKTPLYVLRQRSIRRLLEANPQPPRAALAVLDETNAPNLLDRAKAYAAVLEAPWDPADRNFAWNLIAGVLPCGRGIKGVNVSHCLVCASSPNPPADSVPHLMRCPCLSSLREWFAAAWALMGWPGNPDFTLAIVFGHAPRCGDRVALMALRGVVISMIRTIRYQVTQDGNTTPPGRRETRSRAAYLMRRHIQFDYEYVMMVTKDPPNQPTRWRPKSRAHFMKRWEKMCTVAHGLLIFNELIRRAEEPPD